MSARPAKCTVTDRILNAILVQIVPGKEKETLEEIDQKFGEDTYVYLGFGRYDLVLLREENDFSLLNKFNEMGLSYVRDWFPIVGLKWAIDGEPESKLSEKQKLLGFCCIKLNLEQSDDPVELELSIVRNIRDRFPCLIYSGLGYNELVVVIHARSYRQLANRIVSLKRGLLRRDVPLALDLSTIPAIDYRHFISDKEQSTSKEKISVYLALSLRVGMNRNLKAKLEEITELKRIPSIYGFHDTVVKLSGYSREVVQKVLRVREEGFACGVHSTYTLLVHHDEILDLSFPSSIIEPLKTGMPDFQARQREDVRAIDQIAYYRHWYEAIKQDPMTRHLFRDLSLFFSEVERLRKRVYDLKKTNVVAYMEKNSELDSLLECLRVGFEQRCSGVNPGNLLGQRSAATEPLGGLQRAIFALEALPLFVLEKIKPEETWCGFCIYGFSSRFYRTTCGILNIPHRYRIRPEMWWGIFHEIGHEAFHSLDKETKANIMLEIQRLADRLSDLNADGEAYKDEIYVVVEEIFAELFGFHFGFNDKWELYAQRFWSYFSGEFYLDFRHLGRSVLAYFALGPGKNMTKDEINVEEIDKCLKTIAGIVKKSTNATISESEWNSVHTFVWIFADVADVIRSHFESKPALFSFEKSEKISAALKNGEVVKHDNPLEILFSLVSSDEQKTCKHRFAVILSLFSFYFRSLRSEKHSVVG